MWIVSVVNRISYHILTHITCRCRCCFCCCGSVDKAQPQPRIVGGDNGGWGVRFYTHAHTHTRTHRNVFIVQVQRRLSLWESSMLRSCWCPQRYRQRQLETALHIPHASGWSVLCCSVLFFSVLLCFGGAFIISVSINVEQSLPLLAAWPSVQIKNKSKSPNKIRVQQQRKTNVFSIAFLGSDRQ